MEFDSNRPGSRGLFVVIMGVAGSGKTTVAAGLAARLDWPFYDGDGFHPQSNVEKMARGEPLTDADRTPWLASLRALIESKLALGESGIVACSALKETYRGQLIPPGEASRVRLVYLRVPPDTARERIHARLGHFMPARLVESQFEALEEPDEATVLNGTDPVDRLIEHLLKVLHS